MYQWNVMKLKIPKWTWQLCSDLPDMWLIVAIILNFTNFGNHGLLLLAKGDEKKNAIILIYEKYNDKVQIEFTYEKILAKCSG